MSEQPSSESSANADARTAAGQRRRSPWVFVALLVLLGVWFVVTQAVSHGGPPIDWVYDLDEAERLAEEKHRYIFLLLYEPGCQITAANERNVLSQREIRERLTKMVCCRIELKPDDPLRLRFNFTHEPLMIALRPGRAEPLARKQGRVDYREFITALAPDQHLGGGD